MILFKKKLFNELSGIIEHEDCGFIAGKGNLFYRLYKAKNISKVKNFFKIGLWDRIKITFAIIRDGCDICAVYHVHKNAKHPSHLDIKYRRDGDYMVILFSGIIYLYIVKKTNSNGSELGVQRLKYNVVK